MEEYVNQCKRILRNYRKLSKKGDDITMDQRFIKELVFVFTKLDSLMNEAEAKPDPSYGYVLEKLESIRAQVDYTIQYFEKQKGGD